MGATSNTEARRVEQRRKEHYWLVFAAERGERYHVSRERFLIRCHLVSVFVTAVVGTSAFAALVSTEEPTYLAKVLVGTAALFGVFDLVVGPSRLARRHRDFARDCAELRREALHTGPKPSESELTKLVERRVEIESREPAVRRVLDALCHDELIVSRKLPPSNFSNTNLLQRIFAQVIDITPSRLRVKGQL